MTIFNAANSRALHDVREPTIRTDKHLGSAVVIWIVVGGGTSKYVHGLESR